MNILPLLNSLYKPLGTPLVLTCSSKKEYSYTSCLSTMGKSPFLKTDSTEYVATEIFTHAEIIVLEQRHKDNCAQWLKEGRINTLKDSKSKDESDFVRMEFTSSKVVTATQAVMGTAAATELETPLLKATAVELSVGSIWAMTPLLKFIDQQELAKREIDKKEKDAARDLIAVDLAAGLSSISMGTSAMEAPSTIATAAPSQEQMEIFNEQLGLLGKYIAQQKQIVYAINLYAQAAPKKTQSCRYIRVHEKRIAREFTELEKIQDELDAFKAKWETVKSTWQKDAAAAGNGETSSGQSSFDILSKAFGDYLKLEQSHQDDIQQYAKQIPDRQLQLDHIAIVKQEEELHRQQIKFRESQQQQESNCSIQ